MKEYTLSCFRSFQCIAGACQDSCCVGWEIDVDDDTFARYQAISGSFGQRLRSCITTESDGTHHFILNGERCPFLNTDGLCDIILQQGADALCEICAQHPRFTERFGTFRETGIGLCCEEGARLLLGSSERLTLIPWQTDECAVEDEVDAELLSVLLAQRRGLFAAAQNRTLPITQRLTRLWEQFGGGSFPPLSELTPLEPISPEWTAVLHAALDAESAGYSAPPLTEADGIALEQLLVYFLFRYVLTAAYDGQFASRVRFALYSVHTIEQLCLGQLFHYGKTNRLDCGRIYSKEVEYDEDILQHLLEQLEP